MVTWTKRIGEASCIAAAKTSQGIVVSEIKRIRLLFSLPVFVLDSEAFHTH